MPASRCSERRALTALDRSVPTWHAAIVDPKIKAGLLAIGLAALAAGARACVAVVADIQADVPAVTDLPENPPAVDAGAPDSGVR